MPCKSDCSVLQILLQGILIIRLIYSVVSTVILLYCQLIYITFQILILTIILYMHDAAEIKT